MKILLQLVALVVLVIIAAKMCNGATDSTSQGSTTDASAMISPKGYFKDDLGNRVYTFEISATTTAAQVETAAQNLVFTAGHPMAAYYYVAGGQMPIDGVTLAKDYLQAVNVVDTPGLSRYAYYFQRGIDGSASFTDCLSRPSDPSCVPQK